ncbi:MAG: ABC transporter substrate-binding protein [Kangiellaceae bacterium]|nr:ABC transporter substrate-binding protein [Kangiellaceae bacterium]
MKKLFGALMLIVGLSGAAMAENDPSTYLKSIADKMIDAIDKNKEALKTDDALAEKLVREHLLPVIDSETFARKTLGSKTWKTLSDTQKAKFIKGYIDQVIDKYAKGISLYDGQAFEFQKAEISKKTGNARVKSSMQQEGDEPLGIFYYLTKKSGNWLITNIIVAGSDMRKSYRKQFAPRIKEVGIDQFLEELVSPPKKEKNT